MYASYGEAFSEKKAWLHLQQDILTHQADDISVELDQANNEVFYATVSKAEKAEKLKIVAIVGMKTQGLLVLQNGEYKGTCFDLPSLQGTIAQWSSCPLGY